MDFSAASMKKAVAEGQGLCYTEAKEEKRDL
jgi:hypothetical protein